MIRWHIIFAAGTFYAAGALLGPAAGLAQLPQIADSRLGVDSVKLDSGKRLYGFLIAQRSDRSIVFAVERRWLKSTHPLLFDEFTDTERTRFEAMRKKRIERIETWIEERPNDRGLVAFLDHELARFTDAESSTLDQKKFVGIELASTKYRELSKQPTDRRKIAGLAFQYGAENVTTSPVSQLKRELIELGVDIETGVVNLSDEMATTVSESEREWAARKAVVEHVLRKPLEYQGTGGTLIRKSETVDASALVAQWMGSGGGMDAISQLGAELGLPEFKKLAGQDANWWKKATEEGEKDGYCGVAISRLQQNTLSSTVRVEAYFFAIESPGKWFQVAKFSAEANAAEQTAEQLRQIQEDPQVKSVLNTLSGLGLGNQALIDQALRHGAATQKALQNANGQLNAFISLHSRNLDSQPILLEP